MRLPRVRLHLLTCVVLMFVAGGFIWLNLSERRHPEDYYEIGWPCTILTKRFQIDFIHRPTNSFTLDSKWVYSPANAINTAINIGVATLSLLLIAWLVEHLLDHYSKHSFPE